MTERTVEFVVPHNKPHFPSNKHALEYIQQTVESKLKDLPEVVSMVFESKSDEMFMNVQLGINVIDDERLSVVENRINKTVKKITKKYNTNFTPIAFS